MAGGVPTGEPPAAAQADEADLVAFLSRLLASEDRPRFLLLNGPVGTGKSSLLRALLPRVPGPKLFVGYLPIPAAPGTVGGPQDVALLVADPQLDALAESPLTTPGTDPEGVPPSVDPSGLPAPLRDSLGRLGGHGVAYVDSWDRGSDAFFRAQVRSPRSIRTLTAPASSIGAMRLSILSTPVHLVIAMTPESGAELMSTADAVVDLHETDHQGARIRIATTTKVRGAHLPFNPDYLYTLEEGRFHALPNLPKGFQFPAGPADPDPDERAPTVWPGSASFAEAFGRMRPGGFTGLAMSNDCPDSLPKILAVPLASHVLRIGGRVVWIPSPSIRPSKIIGHLKDQVPIDWIRERFRVISASGDDPGLGDLRSCVLPLRRELSRSDVRTSDAPGIAPIFPDAHRFLRGHPPSTPAIYILSIDGLRAATDSAGITLDSSTMPVVLGTYARIPGFHGFGFGRTDDPLVTLLRSTIDTLLQAEMVFGRPVIYGVRPSTRAYLLDWATPDHRYTLVPVV
jgi:hypothetical protein